MTGSHVWHATCCVCACVCVRVRMNLQWILGGRRTWQRDSKQKMNLYHQSFWKYCSEIICTTKVLVLTPHKTEIVPENTMLFSCSQRKFYDLKPFNCKFCEPGWVWFAREKDWIYISGCQNVLSELMYTAVPCGMLQCVALCHGSAIETVTFSQS